VLLVVVGLSVTWAWGQVAHLAEPAPAEPGPEVAALYAAWQPAEGEALVLHRSLDGGWTWEPLDLPGGQALRTWADDGRNRLAVALEDGSLLSSGDRGESWTATTPDLPVLSLAWDPSGNLYVGTDRGGIYLLGSAGAMTALTAGQAELGSSPVQHLAKADGRLFAATPGVLFYSDDQGESWIKSLPQAMRITALVALDRETLFIGTETSGVYRSLDAGQSWQPALEGLGLAAGQMVRVTALRADPVERGILYAAVDHLLGSTEVHASAAGTYVTIDGGSSWQPLAGATFPEARAAVDLVVAANKPLYVQSVTATGLQSYRPDVEAALAALSSAEPQVRANAAKVLGLARSQAATDALLAALADGDARTGAAAAKALGQIADPSTASQLLVALEHPNEQVRLGAAQALGMMGVQAAVEPLRSMLLNGEGAAVQVAAEALGRIGSPAAVDALAAALSDPDLTARRHAALAAVEQAGEPAVATLVEMLGSQDLYARRGAVQALGWIGSASSTTALVEALEDESPLVRGEAAWALGEIADPAARAALERTLARDASTSVQEAAAVALTHIPAEPDSTARWPSSWVPALARLQAMRWAILGASLVGAAWLAVGNRKGAPLPVGRQVDCP